MSESRPPSAHQLRPATAADTEFLWTLRQRVMKANVEQTWGKWDDAEQRKFFDRGFTPKHANLILMGDQPVGRIDIHHSHMEIFLSIIELLPEFQGRGIGSAVTLGLMAEAAPARLPIRLQVLKANDRARRLYDRLGFKATGETTTHHLMIWAPAGATITPWSMPRG